MLPFPMDGGQPIARTFRGVSRGLRSRPGVFLGVFAAMAALSLAAPVILLSIARKPVDFFTFNPWLPRLPDYLASPQPLSAKLSLLAGLKIAWASAEGSEGLEWGFVVDVATLGRVLFTALLFGAFFALWSHARATPAESAARPAGVVGALTSVFGLTTGPCSIAGCGAPVLPVIGLAFTGASGTTLSVFAAISRISFAVVVALMLAAVAWFGWRAGANQDP